MLLRCESLEPPMSQLGQSNWNFSANVSHVRFTPDNRT